MIFIDNKYTTWYYSIINQAKNRVPPNTYLEKHHIIPQSLGGTNDSFNLIKLTAREHFVCHWLLTKMTSGKFKAKMLNAAFMMSTNHNPSQKRYKISSRVYEILKKAWAARPISAETREKISKSSTGRKHSEETIKKNREASLGKNNAMYGKTHTEEARKKISEARKGKPSPNKGKKLTPKQRLHLSNINKGKSAGAKNGMFGKKHSEEAKQKISNLAKGRKRSPETISKWKASMIKNYWKKNITPDL